MSARRAAAWTIVGALAVAWFASAAGVIGQPWRAPRAPVQRSAAPPDEPLSFDVQAQAERLRKRLATAPAPQPVRNPFVFVERGPRRTVRPAAVNARQPHPDLVAPVDVEPPLALIGMAEDGAGASLVRTAMIAGPGDELFLVTVGQSLGRYRVAAIRPDAVDLQHETTGRVRRLVLQ
jgi:hypothetical protein